MMIVSYGAGTNSTAMLIQMLLRGESCDVITFADTGGERPETYAYLNMFSEWLHERGYPKIITVRNDGMYVTLENNCLRKKMLPSLAYGFKSCSDKYKARPQNKYFNQLPEAKLVWAAGQKIVKCIGYDADESRRAKVFQDDKYLCRYPLIEWDMGREECVDVILNSGLPLPGKSACFFCPATKKPEILDLQTRHPDLLQRALDMEAQAELISVKGLGRNFSWKEFIGGKNVVCTVEQACGCYDG